MELCRAEATAGIFAWQIWAVDCLHKFQSCFFLLASSLFACAIGFGCRECVHQKVHSGDKDELRGT